MTEEEKQEIVNRVTEQVFLMIPQMVGNLIVTKYGQMKEAEEFYKKHTEFDAHRETVAKVISEHEGRTPGRPVREIAEEAVPDIRKRITQVKNIDVESFKMPTDDDRNTQGKL